MNGRSVVNPLGTNRLVVNQDFTRKYQSLLANWNVPFLLYFPLQILNCQVRVYLDFLSKIYAPHSDRYLWPVQNHFLHHKRVRVY